MEPRVLGGETSRRGFFGGTRGKGRAGGLITVATVGGFGVLFFGVTALVIALLAALAVFVLTIKTHRGSPLARIQRTLGWRERLRTGTVTFIPVRERPEGLEGLEETGGDRAARKEAARAWAAYRDWPDGAEGMHWLQRTPRQPGICWHTPTGEDAYLSVAFSVEGQVRGIEGDAFLDTAQLAFGQLLARYGSPSALPNRVQSLTRVLPVDSANHEQWVVGLLDDEHLDSDNPTREFLASYAEVVTAVSAQGFMQRHYMVIRWPLTGPFIAAAARRGPAQAGWLALMAGEIESVRSHLVTARLGRVSVLSAAQLAAVIRHQQNPSWPIDQVNDVDVAAPWVSSVDELSATVNTGPGPDGTTQTWWHRTAAIPVEAMETSLRTSLWLAPVLTQLPHPIVRTVSLQTEVVPAAEARRAARMDVTTDLADLEAQQQKGVLTSEELTAGLAAARSRLDDLRPGSGHAGAGWAGHITISARTRTELVEATAQITEAAGNAGIASLEWLDTQQAAAAACTWPIARGMHPVNRGAATTLRGVLAGTGSRDAI